MLKCALRSVIFLAIKDVNLGTSTCEVSAMFYGEENCKPGHSFGPAIRNHYLIHYVVSGKGKFYKDDREYEVSAGEIFIILPDEITTYTADIDNPWTYQWIGFKGESAKKLDDLPAVIKLNGEFFREMREYERWKGAVSEFITSKLCMVLAEIFKNTKPKNEYVKAVKNIIDGKYMKDLSVEEIAKNLCIDRRHLTRLFKRETGYTISQYIINVRMEQAKVLLLNDYSVSEVSELCGYNQLFSFSKSFKRVCGVSPSEYKQKSR